MFVGSITFNPSLAWNPNPSPIKDDLIYSSSDDMSVLSDTSIIRPGGETPTERLKREMQELQRRLQDSPESPDAYKFIGQLHGLRRYDFFDATKERNSITTLINSWAEQTLNAAATGRRLSASRQRAGEVAVLCNLDELVLQEKYDDARVLLTAAEPAIGDSENLIVLSLKKMTLQEQAGRYRDALTTLEIAKRRIKELRPTEPNRLDIVEQNLRTKLNSREAFEQPVVKDGEVVLEQNYPNPFNPITSIRYAVPTAGQVSLRVFDMLGREVAVLVNEQKAAGSHVVQFNGNNLASGVYIYRLQSGGVTRTMKMLLVK